MSRLLFVSAGVALLLSTVAAASERIPAKHGWGDVVVASAAVELHVKTVPQDRIVRVPPFNNPYSKIYLRSDPEKQSLEFTAEVREWLVTLPKSVGDSCVVVIETVGSPRLSTSPVVVRSDRKGILQLPAHYSVCHGDKLRYEPQPHKNTVGYWTVEDDWCEWKFHVEQPGLYQVVVFQGCGEGDGGSEVEVRVGASRLGFIVEDTGHFQNFKERPIGTLRLVSGEQTLQIRPIRKAQAAVMDVRWVRLVPVTEPPARCAG